MNRLILLITILLAGLPMQLVSQTDVKIKKSELQNDNTGFKEAWKHVKAGDGFFNEKGEGYGIAFTEYMRAVAYNGNNPELNYKAGVSALLSNDKDKAADLLVKAADAKPTMTSDILLLTGMALQHAGKFNESISKYEAYLSARGRKSDSHIAAVRKKIDESKAAIDLVKDTLNLKIDNLGSAINSKSDDYSEVLSANGQLMYFASRREAGKKSTRHADDQYDENIYISTIIDGAWSSAGLTAKPLSTEYSETPLLLSADGLRLYLYAGYINGGDIRVSYNKKGKWRLPAPVPYNINTKGSETSFAFSPDGNEIYFISDKGRGSSGSKDIYLLRRMNEKKWSRPENAGMKINSVYDEESIRFSITGDTLWFSSKGHNTMGGFDIFFSIRSATGEWQAPTNAGFPLNTPADELFFYPAPDHDSLYYFVSNRPEGMGGLDIYKCRFLPVKIVVDSIIIQPPADTLLSMPVINTVTLPPARRDTIVIRDTVVVVKETVKEIVKTDTVPPQVIVPVAEVVPVPAAPLALFVSGTVKDSESGSAIMARIELIDMSTDKPVATTASSDVDGTYRISLPAKGSYMADVRAAGFLSDMKRITIPANYQDGEFNFDMTLVKVKVGKKVVLNNILFESGKTILTAGSYAELDKLIEMLQENKTMKIEISGHTDKTGSEAVNFTLSEARAKSVVEYLVTKGIDRSRLTSAGFGSLQPIADNATPAGRTKNRRVEFKITEF